MASPPLPILPQRPVLVPANPRPTVFPLTSGRSRRTSPRTTRAIEGATDLGPPPDMTWQIAVGALAGVTPFVVAGIEFSKRIVAQRRCQVCGGSGLVLMEDQQYTRCPGCGGFLPWQSWKRFFTG